jgi:ATP-binding cassette subfamily B protein
MTIMLKRIREFFLKEYRGADGAARSSMILKTAQVRDLLMQHPDGQAPDIRFCEAADLTAAGRFGEEWLAITKSQVLVFTVDNATLHFIHRLEISALRSAEIVMLTGCGVLRGETTAGQVPLAFFTNAKNERFSNAGDILKRLISGGQPSDADPGVKTAEEKKPKVCDVCREQIPEGNDTCPRCSHKGRTLLRIMDFTRPYTGFLLLIFLFMVLSTGCGLVTPYLSKLFIDYIFKPDNATGAFPYASWLLPAIILLFCAYGAQVFLGGVQERFSGKLGYKTAYDVRKAVYARLQELSLSYFDKHTTGGLLSRVNQDTSDLQYLIVDFFPVTLESVLLLAGVGIFLFVLSWQLTLFILLPVLVTLYFGRRIFNRVGTYFHRYFHRRSRLSDFVNDSLSGIRVIKAFGQEKAEVRKFDSRSASYRDAGMDLVRKWSVYHPVLQFFIMAGGVMVWAIGGELIFLKKMTVGSVVAYSGYLAMFYQPVLTLAHMVQAVSNSLAAAQRVFAVIDATPDIMDASDAVPLTEMIGAIDFRAVTFGYSKFKPVINSLDMAIASREKIGLVGKSGAGKSTIINLLCRLYDADGGQILVDGIDIRKIRGADLRSRIGVVLQETFLFNGTIYDNIAYAKPQAQREAVIDAAIAANAHEFIVTKPDGYDTEVGERGARLSGGEKQRIAIARAILRDPAILILDEALSSVDTQTENKIQEALANLTKGRTTIAIAHRLSTLRTYHRLFVIENGRCVESGTHEQLMEKKGAFFELVKLQERLSHIAPAEEPSHDRT